MKTLSTFKVLTCAIFIVALSSLAQAQATRTWVSGVGDDVNPCSRTAPCKTFAGAISKTAAGGEIDALDPGGYGTLTITKGITVDGAGTMASTLAAGTNGFIINDAATPPTAIVTLRNISINGAGTGFDGVRILKAKTVHIENCEIFGFTGDGIDAPLSSVATGGTEAFFDDVDIRNLSGASSVGIKLSAPASFFSVGMDHVRIQRVPTGVQIGAQSHATIRNSAFTHSTIAGVELLNAAGAPSANIENTMLTNNGTGLIPNTGSTTRLSQVSIIECSTDISNSGGTVRSSGNNRILDNTAVGLVPTIITPK